jgi:hypothetical protein
MYTVASAFAAAEKAFFGKNWRWKPVSDLQRRFVSEILEPTRSELAYIPEIESIASSSEAPINEFLRRKGFDIQLDKFPEPSRLERPWGAASVLDVLMKWEMKGVADELETPDGKTYPAARLSKKAVDIVCAGNVDVAILATQSADVAYMAMWDKQVEHFELLAAVENLSRARKSYAPYEGLIFPMVDLDHEVDIGWLKGLSTTPDEKGYVNIITQALQQTKLKMNHVGARIKDAVTIGGIRFTASLDRPLPPLIINKPFLFWVKRPGLSRPLFAARITEEHWKNPGSLEM